VEREYKYFDIVCICIVNIMRMKRRANTNYSITWVFF
jgi:hypothetical protein